MNRVVPPEPWVKICGVTRPEDAAVAVELGATMVGLNFWPPSPRFVADQDRAREIAEAAKGRALVVGVFVDEEPGRIEELAAECRLDLVQLHGDEPEDVVARFGERVIRALRAERAGEALSVRDQYERHSIAGKSLMGLTRAPAGGRGGGAVAAPEPGGEGIARRLESSGETRGSGRSPEGGLPLQWKSLSGETSVADLQVALQENVFCWLLDGPAGPLRGGAGAAWDWAQARPLVAAAAVPVVVAGGIRPDNIRRALAASGAAGVDLASGVETSPGVKSRELMMSLFEEVARVRR